VIATRLLPCLKRILVTLLQYRKYTSIQQRFRFAIVMVGWCFSLETGILQPQLVQAQTTGSMSPGTSIIPSLAVSERYDSNVYLAPAEFLPAGTQVTDFVTTVQGSVKILHNSKNAEASLTGGVDGNLYAHNTGLNYISTRADLFANLSGLAQRLIKGAQLSMYDYFRYTPTSPGFLTGGQAGTQDPFLRGIQSFRANTFSNTLQVNGVFPLFRAIAAQAGYTFGLFRVGSVFAQTSTGASFFDTNLHTWSAGPRWQLSHIDSVTLLFQQSLISQTTGVGGSSIDTNTQSLTANFRRATPNWLFNASGGVALIEPASKAFPTGRITISNKPEERTTIQLDLTRIASPSFYLQGGAMISNVATLQISHRLTRLLTLRGSANYGYNEIVPTESNITFTNLTLSAGLNYKLTRTMSIDLFYDHNDFTTDSPNLSYTLLRNVVGFALKAEWY